MQLSRQRFLLCTIIFIAVGIGVGFCIGYLTKTGTKEDNKPLVTSPPNNRKYNGIQDELLNEIQAETIRGYLRELTRHPHLAGTPADLEQAEELKKFWDENGFDRTALYPYNVMLSYPNESNPNRIVLLDENDAPVFTTQLYEKILRPEQNQSDVVPPFNAYSASGEPRGDLVYVNYGRFEDFMWLENNRGDNGFSVSGKICIARYGKIYRGNKAEFAERYGCIGLILYSDPEDVTRPEIEPYPDSWYLPETGVQRGSLKPPHPLGDPLTAGYPSIESAYRIREQDANIPNIPVHPIGYGDAKELLERMSGNEAPEQWRGGLNITYRLGPGFSNHRWTVQMFISTHAVTVTTYNVMGFIEGAVEPDRYVLVGNHRDAWVFGAIDPSSGTAAMMELSRAFGVMLKNGWRPRRTIVFCSWGAEEYGLVGSSEWVEDYNKILGDRAVAYLNCDISILGNASLAASGVPMLHDVMREAAHLIPNPNPVEVGKGRHCLYSTWRRTCFETDGDGNPTNIARIMLPGSGSDHAPFIGITGVPSMMIWYGHSPGCGTLSYPLYHSVYETFHLVETYYDPDFLYHKAITQYWGEVTRRLADDVILPLNVTAYAKGVQSYIQHVETLYGDILNINVHAKALEYLHNAVEKFDAVAKTFTSNLAQNDNLHDPLRVRMYNDQMMKLERVFIDPLGLPGRKIQRHVVFAPSVHNVYSGASFPGLVDSLFELQQATLPAEITDKAEVVKQQLAIVTYFIGAAAAFLQNAIGF